MGNIVLGKDAVLGRKYRINEYVGELVCFDDKLMLENPGNGDPLVYVYPYNILEEINDDSVYYADSKGKIRFSFPAISVTV